MQAASKPSVRNPKKEESSSLFAQAIFTTIPVVVITTATASSVPGSSGNFPTGSERRISPETSRPKRSPMAPVSNSGIEAL